MIEPLVLHPCECLDDAVDVLVRKQPGNTEEETRVQVAVLARQSVQLDGGRRRQHFGLDPVDVANLRTDGHGVRPDSGPHPSQSAGPTASGSRERDQRPRAPETTASASSASSGTATWRGCGSTRSSSRPCRRRGPTAGAAQHDVRRDLETGEGGSEERKPSRCLRRNSGIRFSGSVRMSTSPNSGNVRAGS